MNEELIISSLGKHRGLAAIIVDCFEDLLDEHHIAIPDADRTGEGSEAPIYGTTYSVLLDRLEAILRRHIK